jgi:Domain of unknown function (DUF5666)
MNLSTLTLARAPGWLRATLLLALLGGCGGGVDSGGTGGATVYASGPINGYGSVIVNGVRFDDSASSITDDDGNTRQRSQLKLGMLVEVRGTPIGLDTYGDPASTANSIVLSSEIVGPIDANSINTTMNSFAVLGRNIDVKPTTVFASGDTEGLPGGLSALVSGNIVEVYGLYDALNDRFTATRIERKSSLPQHYRVRGPVGGLDTLASTFSIGSLLIDYGSVPAGERPSFSNGKILRVRLLTTGPAASGARIANRLRAGVSSPDDGTESKLEGLIDSIAVGTPTPQFTVNGVSVTTNAQTLFSPQGATLLVGMRVEVEGRFSNGALAATEVEVEDSAGDDFDFRGPIQSVDLGAATLRINNVDIDYSAVNDWKGNGTGPLDLAPGRNVRVRAILVDSITYRAYEIDFRN